MASENYVVDTSIVIDGRIVEMVEERRIKGVVIIPQGVIAELEHQANLGKETGFAGFTTIKKLRQLEKEGKIEVVIAGERPRESEIANAKLGAIDAMIRKLAKEMNATLITGDKVQYAAALAEGIETLYLQAREEKKGLSFEKYFTPDTMSVHIREGCEVKAKIGRPGRWRMVKLGEVLSREEVRRISEEIIEATKRNVDYYFEIDRTGASVIQMGDYRIVIAKPPFSDGFEIYPTSTRTEGI